MKSLTSYPLLNLLWLAFCFFSIPLTAQVHLSDDNDTVWHSGVSFLYILNNDTASSAIDVTSFSSIVSPQHALLFQWQPIEERIIYTPQASFTGQDSFQYSFCTLGSIPGTPGGCDTAWVRIEVTDICDPNLCVLPGDANLDGKANNEDILALGIKYNMTGPSRLNASTMWNAQPAANWGSTLFGADIKHADYNGDGVINASDKTVLEQNYDTTSVLKTKTASDDAPSMEIELDLNEYEEGEVVTVYLTLGTEEEPIEDVYGFTANIYYDPALVVQESWIVDYSESWVTQGAEYLDVMREMPDRGQLDIGVTRRDGSTVTGFGTVAVLQFEIIDNLDEKQDRFNAVTLELNNPKVVNASGDILLLNAGKITAPITSIEANNDIRNKIIFFPNPTNDILNMQYHDVVIDNVELVALTGEVVKRFTDFPEGQLTFSLDGVASNIYFLKIQTNRGSLVEKLIKQ